MAGVLTFAATIAGAYFAFRSQPRSPTTAGWVSQANVACDRDSGSIHLPFFNGTLPAVEQTPGQNVSAGQQMASRLRDMITAEGSLSKLNGDLAALPTPEDNGTTAVRAVLRSGITLVDRMEDFSDALQNAVDSGSISAAVVAAEAKQADAVLAAELTWQKAIAVLGLRQCPFWTADPPRAPQTMTPSASSLTEGEQRLADQLNLGDLHNCTGRPGLETDGVIAAINCQNVQPGPTERPLVVQFSDAQAAQAWFQDNTSRFVNNDDCAAGEELGTWYHDGFPAGPWGCDYLSSDDFRMVWVADSPLIGIIADGSDGVAMYSWWSSWAYVTGG